MKELLENYNFPGHGGIPSLHCLLLEACFFFKVKIREHFEVSQRVWDLASEMIE